MGDIDCPTEHTDRKNITSPEARGQHKVSHMLKRACNISVMMPQSSSVFTLVDLDARDIFLNFCQPLVREFKDFAK
jgi:hypothetical protein